MATDRPPLELDAAKLAGALADDDRRSVFAAVQLGASSVDAVVEATRLDRVRIVAALSRLASIGLIVESSGTLVVLGAAFAHAARQALARPPLTEHDDQPPEARQVLNVFVADGRIVGHPASPGKRRVVLDWLAQDFEPGVRYTEREVNEILRRRADDHVTWRRYLIDACFLDRADGVYWRTGGTVPASGAPGGGC